ncbi:MAG TPA: hypothetical protein VES19_08950 [Candidatus Limnocylindrales bacterium]|nr:hypothetical protein [Candidatus Limnocylindrales bacterium]
MFRGPALVAVALFVAACGGSVPPPAASPAASAPAATAMPAGTYTSVAFQPAVTFTVPDGWVIAGDSAKFFQLSPAGNEIDGIYLFRDAAAASQDPSCPDEEEPGVGRTSVGLVTWIRSLPGLTVSNPAMATIGGLPATSIDAGIAEGWKQSCSFANGSPTVPLFFGGASGYRWIVYGTERMRLYITDLPSGGTVTVNINTIDGPYIDQLIAQSLPIVKSMTFALDAPASAPASVTP